MRKRFYVLLLAGVLGMAFTACAGKGSSEAPSEENTQQEQDDVIKIEKGAESQEQETVLAGTVTDASTNTLTLTAADGNAYLFSTVGADIEAEGGITVGAQAEVSYKGTLNGTDTSGVTVAKVKVAAPAGTTVYAIVDSNIRDTPSKSGQIVGSVKKGTSIQKLEDTEDGWCKIQYLDREAYIFGQLVSETPPEGVDITTPTPTPAAEGTGQSTPAPQQSQEQQKPQIADDGTETTFSTNTFAVSIPESWEGRYSVSSSSNSWAFYDTEVRQAQGKGGKIATIMIFTTEGAWNNISMDNVEVIGTSLDQTKYYVLGYPKDDQCSKVEDQGIIDNYKKMVEDTKILAASFEAYE